MEEIRTGVHLGLDALVTRDCKASTASFPNISPRGRMGDDAISSFYLDQRSHRAIQLNGMTRDGDKEFLSRGAT